METINVADAHCVHCGSRNLEIPPGMYFLTMLRKAGAEIAIDPMNGQPVTPVVCQACGHTSLFDARKIGRFTEWQMQP